MYIKDELQDLMAMKVKIWNMSSFLQEGCRHGEILGSNFHSISELLQICLDKKAVQVSSTLQVIYF